MYFNLAQSIFLRRCDLSHTIHMSAIAIGCGSNKVLWNCLKGLDQVSLYGTRTTYVTLCSELVNVCNSQIFHELANL